MNAPTYTTGILRLAAALEHPRALEREDGRAELRSPTCGATIETVVTVDEGKVAAISQRVSACAFGQASASLLERGARGASREDVARTLAELGDWLTGGDCAPHWPGIEELNPARPKRGRHGAILLPFRALLAAMDAAR